MTHTIETLTAAVTAALDAKEANKFGNKEAAVEVSLADGKVASCTITRSRNIRRGTTVRTQYKIDGKVIARSTLEKLMAGTLDKPVANEALRAAFEARAPELAEDMVQLLTATWERLAARYPDGVPRHIERNKTADYNLVHHTFNGLTAIVPGTEDRLNWRAGKLTLDLARVEAFAKKYGEHAALDWFHKTGAKLGELTEAEVVYGSDASLIVLGKRDGKTVQIEQQRILKASPKGKLFHQFPSRIYVNGKFTPEAAYARLFA